MLSSRGVLCSRRGKQDHAPARCGSAYFCLALRLPSEAELDCLALLSWRSAQTAASSSRASGFFSMSRSMRSYISLPSTACTAFCRWALPDCPVLFAALHNGAARQFCPRQPVYEKNGSSISITRRICSVFGLLIHVAASTCG